MYSPADNLLPIIRKSHSELSHRNWTFLFISVNCGLTVDYEVMDCCWMIRNDVPSQGLQHYTDIDHPSEVSIDVRDYGNPFPKSETARVE